MKVDPIYSNRSETVAAPVSSATAENLLLSVSLVTVATNSWFALIVQALFPGFYAPSLTVSHSDTLNPSLKPREVKSFAPSHLGGKR